MTKNNSNSKWQQQCQKAQWLYTYVSRNLLDDYHALENIKFRKNLKMAFWLSCLGNFEFSKIQLMTCARNPQIHYIHTFRWTKWLLIVGVILSHQGFRLGAADTSSTTKQTCTPHGASTSPGVCYFFPIILGRQPLAPPSGQKQNKPVQQSSEKDNIFINIYIHTYTTRWSIVLVIVIPEHFLLSVLE